MSSASQPSNGTICSNCKQLIPANATYCPTCGQANPLMSGAYTTNDATMQGSWPNQTTQAATPPPATPPVYVAPYAATAVPFTPATVPTSMKPKRGPGRVIAGFSVALLVAVILGIGGYTLYNVLAAHAEGAAAQVAPNNTVAYTSIDVVQYAKNSHNFNINNLFSGANSSQNQAGPIKQATGLSWQSDILPWVNRDIAVAVFERPAPTAANSANPGSQLGAAILIQSKDDSAALKAMKKAADFQKSQGHTISQSAYGNFTLYSISDGGSTFTAGSGWAIIATDTSAAHTLIDRINGKGQTLANNQAYQSAISNLPNDRFGTVFVNIKELYTLFSSTTGAAANSTLSPLANTYPTAGGFLEWTSNGLRIQVTLKAAKSLGIGDLHGDTTSLASLAPQNTMLYAGIGNLGAELTASTKISSAFGGSSSDPVQTLLGVPSSTPALQQPAAVLASSGSGAGALPGEALLLKAPDATAAQALLQQIATKNHLTLKPIPVVGQTATGIYSANGGSFPLLGTTTPRYTYAQPAKPVAVAAQVNGVFVVASSSDMLTAIINTANGGQSLAQQGDFRQLTQNAPADAASSVFVSLSSLKSLLGNLQNSGSIGQLLAKTSALLITGSSNDQQSQSTIDFKVNN